MHVQHNYFSSFNQSDHYSLASSLPLLSSLLKLPVKQPRRRLWLKRQKIAYLTMKNRSFARFAHFYTYRCRSGPFYEVKWPVLQSTTWAHDDKFALFSPNRWYQFNSRILGIYFASKMTWNIKLENYYRNSKWYFQMMFSLSSTSDLAWAPYSLILSPGEHDQKAV